MGNIGQWTKSLIQQFVSMMEPVPPLKREKKWCFGCSGDDARYLVESGLVEKFNEKNEKYYVELVEMTFDTLHDKLLRAQLAVKFLLFHRVLTNG